MTIKPIKDFATISQRILYGLNFMYSEFMPIESEKADVQSQKKLHAFMGQIIDKLYEDPSRLSLADNADEAYEWHAINNTNPGLDKVYQSIFKRLFDFYKFLYISFLFGEIRDQSLSISNAELRKHKTSCMTQYKDFLFEIGITIEITRAEVSVIAEKDIISGFNLLAERIPVNMNPWTPYSIINFACCSFTGDFHYLLKRVDKTTQLNGLLHEIQQNCLDNGYEQSIKCSFGASGIDFGITFRNKVGGFIIGYYPRKYWQFYFGSLNGIGVKAMLEAFEDLDNDLQKYLILICKPCNECLACTKGGRNMVFAVKVKHEGKEYDLCPDTFARQNWQTLTPDLIAVLCKYHAAQEKYGSDWK